MMDSSREVSLEEVKRGIIKIVQNGILSDAKGFKFKP
jgi:hypothetical protein